MPRVISATAFAAAALAFALPFGVVSSCDGPEVHFTGVELATFSVPAEDGSDEALADDLEGNASAVALALLVAALAGVVLSAFGESGTGMCAAAGLVLAQVLLYAIGLTSDGSDLFVGYWLTLGSFVVAGIVAFVQEVRARLRRGRSAWAPVGYGIAVVLPPLGAVVAGLGVLVALAARWLGREPKRLRAE